MEIEANPIKEGKFPLELCCYTCKSTCDDPVQIMCCDEIFCKKHLEEEITKNYLCPACNHAASLNDFFPNKSVNKLITWYSSFIDIDKNSDEKAKDVIADMDPEQVIMFQKMLEMAKTNTSYAEKLGIKPKSESREKEKKERKRSKSIEDKEKDKERRKSHRSKRRSDSNSSYGSYHRDKDRRREKERRRRSISRSSRRRRKDRRH